MGGMMEMSEREKDGMMEMRGGGEERMRRVG